MVKFRYNGVLLPGIPDEVNQNVYPCAFITKNRNTGMFDLICTGQRVYCSEGVTPVVIGWDASANRGRAFCCESGDGVWFIDSELDTEMREGNSFLMFSADLYEILWTNTDITSSVGTLYLRATEPIAGFDLKSWLIGLAMGIAGEPMPADAVKNPLLTGRALGGQME